MFVYRRHDDEFTRVPVEPARPVGDAWLVRGGLKAGDEIVVMGAQQLLSEELKGPSSEE